MNMIMTMKGDKSGSDAKWVWFDLDDTLYDFRESSEIALQRVFDSRNLGRWFSSLQQWKDIYHKHNAELWLLYNAGEISKEYLKMERFRRPLVEVGADEATARELSLAMDGEYLHELAVTGLTLPGTHSLLQHLRDNGIKIGILSNGFTEVQYDKLRSAEIDRLVDCVVLSDEIGINKPDRRIFDYALEKSGARLENCIMVGDNPDTDIAGAVNAGWQARLFNPLTEKLENLIPELL